MNSFEDKTAGGVILPRKLTWPMLALLIGPAFAFAIGYVDLNRQMTELQAWKEQRIQAIAEEEKALDRIEFTLRRMCTHHMGADKCANICKDYSL
jgi:hypothetical protein